ncbi:MAG: hypothetical protein P8H05_00875 [Schleiferiaceae bacterium]|nr:hypothetical protein [Schleiferiaceae bacterium]
MLICSGTIDYSILTECINISWRINDKLSALYFLKKSQLFFGDNYQTTNALRNVFLQLRQVDSALTYVENYMHKSGNEINGSLLYINTLNKIGQQYESYIALKGLVNQYPDALPIKIAFIEASFALGKKDTAGIYFKRLAKDADVKIDVKVSVIANAMKGLIGSSLTQGWELLFKWSQWNIKANPNEPQAYAISGDIAAQQSRWMNARNLWRKAVSLPDGDLWELRQGILLADEKLDSIHWMINDAQEASKNHSKNPLFSLMLANAEYKNQNLKIAVEEAKHGISKLRGFSPVKKRQLYLVDYYYALGNMNFQLENQFEMSNCFDTVLKWKPNDVITLNNYSYFLAKLNYRLDYALEMIEKVNKAFPNDPTFLDTYAFILYKMEKYPEAEEKIKFCLENGGQKNSETCLHAAAIFKLTGQRELYQLYYQHALDHGIKKDQIEKVINGSTKQ